jgi:hypothetical protein
LFCHCLNDTQYKQNHKETSIQTSLSLIYKNNFDSYTDINKIYAKIKQLPSFLKHYKNLLSAHWASKHEFEKTEKGKKEKKTKKKKNE